MFISILLFLGYVFKCYLLLDTVAALALSYKEVGVSLLIIALVIIGIIIYYHYVKSISPRFNGKGKDVPTELPRRRFIISTFIASIVGSIAAMVIPVLDAITRGYPVSAKLPEGAGEVKITNISRIEPNSHVPFVMRVDPTGRPGMYPAMLIRLPDDLASEYGSEFIAFSAVCTHLGCIVSYKSDVRKIFCPCHAGYFDPISGRPISGPPKKPLRGIKLRIDESSGDIYAVGWF